MYLCSSKLLKNLSSHFWLIPVLPYGDAEEVLWQSLWGSTGMGKIKAQTGPVKKFSFLLAGILAGKEFSTGPDRTGRSAGPVTTLIN